MQQGISSQQVLIVLENYAMKIGEKSRKNFPLERLFTVIKIRPAIPKPIKVKLWFKGVLRRSYVQDSQEYFALL